MNTRKIRQLYPQEAEKVQKELVKLIKEFKAKNPQQGKKKRQFFSEKDVILICYADHVKESGVKTLKTMQKFLHQYVKGYINKIHFLPFYPYSSDDGFSVIDYYKVNSPFGNWKDIRKINKDFGFMFDLVLNHISSKSKWFKKFLEHKGYQDYFIAFDKEIDTSKVFRPRTSPLLTPFKTKRGLKYVWTTFSQDQIDLNFSNPEVFLEIVKILLFYIQNGAEAIRFDAVAYAWKKLGTSCFDLPQAHTLVQLLHDILEEAAPNTWIISETVLPHKKNITYFGNGRNEAHLVYNFVLETLLLHTFLQQDASLATKWLKSIKSPSDTASYLNLSVSHDGIHTIPAKGVLNLKDVEAIARDAAQKGGKVLYRSVPGKDPEPYEFNITYPSAIDKVGAYLASQAIQIALKGVPLIYFNNLIGAENWLKGVEKLGYGRAINRQKFDYKKLAAELENPSSKKHKIYTGYTKLLKTRTNEPLFSPLADQKILNISPSLVAILRSRGKKKLLALTNVTEKVVGLPVNKIKKALGKNKAKEILGQDNIRLEKSLILNPYQIMWLK